MADVELPDLPAAVVVNPSDLLLVRQGAEDKKATVQLFSDSLDTIYLRQDDNLASLDDVAEARVNLDVLSSTELADIFLEEANNLSDLTNVPAARNNLGLGTAAIENIQTSGTDLTVGALMAVGAFGLGVTIGVGVSDLDNLNGTQTARFDSGTSNIPPFTAFGTVHHIQRAVDEATQFAQQTNGYLTSIRFQVLNVWSSWKDVWTEDNLVKGVATSTDLPTRGDADARYLLESNNLSDLVSASTARNNLGLATGATTTVGTMAVEDTGTIGTQFRDNTANDARFLLESNDLSDLVSASTARTNLGLASGATTTVGTLATQNEGTGSSQFRDNLANDAQFLIESNNLSDLTSVSTARSNLGLGTLATQNEGTGTGDFRDNSDNDARFLLESNNLSDVTNTTTAFSNIKQSATTASTGVVEVATTVEMESGAADKFPDAATINAFLIDSDSLSGVSGDFTAGTVTVERSGHIVTVTGLLNYPTGDFTPSSASGYIPTEFRPTSASTSVYSINSAFISMVLVATNGTLSFNFRDYSGSSVSTTTTSSQFTITYIT